MRLLTALCVTLAIAGCAGNGRAPSPPMPEPTAAAPNETPGVAGTPGPAAPGDTGVPVPPPEEVEEAEAGCRQAVQLAAAGEHKPAVDALTALSAAGGRCEQSVLDAVAGSERRLAEADALVRRGLDQRRAGDLEGARQSYDEALVVYPRYYWVERLIANLSTESTGEIAGLRQQAAARLAAGQPQAALEALERAADLAPESDLAAEAARLRTEIGDASLTQAHRAQQNGDLELAVELANRALTARPDPPVRDRAVEFARQLGLALFSAGELIRAEAIWRAALALDAGNELLQQYLDEVASRLESLDQIKKNSGD